MFLQDGTRIPVTQIKVDGNVVAGIKTKDKNLYDALQIGFGAKKRANKSFVGFMKKANLSFIPRFLREIKVADGENLPKLGDVIKPQDVFKPGDIVDAIGISKGKGFAGGVKKHHFKGGPRTHGQSDRERAPGSIGQTTTPGRVYKGKRMAGHMGSEKVTIKNLEIVAVDDIFLYVKGLVPGSVNSLLKIEKVGENKKFVSLFKESSSAEASTFANASADKSAGKEEKVGVVVEPKTEVEKEDNQGKEAEKKNAN